VTTNELEIKTTMLLSSVNQLFPWAIFNSYVSLPEGNKGAKHFAPMCFSIEAKLIKLGIANLDPNQAQVGIQR
jgi:hypothetical protein